jgi:predicted O-methyltransferase YrrM
MDEHYQFNNTRSGTGAQYFADSISRVSCSKWDHEDQAVPLKTANMPPWRADWQEFIDDLGIDVIKMHGRESKTRLKETMSIIKRYAAGDEILFDGFNDFIEETNMADKPIEIWRKKIKTCNFDCWDCGYCDKIMKAKYGDKRNPKSMMVVKAIVDAVNIEPLGITIEGLTSPRVQSLLNVLASKSSTYLEVGTFLGATAAAALNGNKIKAYLVDNWADGIQPAEANVILPDNDKDEFILNIEPYIGKSDVEILDGDMFSFGPDRIKDVDLFFYDGPHDHATVSKAVQHFAPCLAPGAVLVFDDANWTDTLTGADEGIKKAGLEVAFSRKIINAIESSQDWWNGLYVIVLK